MISILIIFISSTSSISVFGNVVDEAENKVELRFKEGGKEDIKPPKVNPENNYKPSEPQKIKQLLPQTGETILSFMFILIGLSITLLIVGIHTMKRVVGIYSYN